jgi:hypothetical protein
MPCISVTLGRREEDENTDLGLRLHALPGESEDLHFARRESNRHLVGDVVAEEEIVAWEGCAGDLLLVLWWKCRARVMEEMVENV